MDCLSRTPSPISRGYQARRFQMAPPFPSVTIFLAHRSLPGFFSRSATILKLIQGQPLMRMAEATALASDPVPVHLSLRIIRIHLSPEAAAAMAVLARQAPATRRGVMFSAQCFGTPIWAAVAEQARVPGAPVVASFVSQLVGFCGSTDTSQPMAPKALIHIPAAVQVEVFICRPKLLREWA